MPKPNHTAAASREGCDKVSTRNFDPVLRDDGAQDGEPNRRQDEHVGDRMAPHVAHEKRNRLIRE